MPPAALMSATACSAPFLSWAPKAAFGPVNGPPTPTLIWALTGPDKAKLAATASPVNHTFLMEISLFVDTLQHMHSARRHFRRAASWLLITVDGDLDSVRDGNPTQPPAPDICPVVDPPDRRTCLGAARANSGWGRRRPTAAEPDAILANSNCRRPMRRCAN